jgi:L-seryl-tRNA(Ser) seleniumtransferase
VVLHTNLGRAPLGPDARAALLDVMEGYCNAEMDLSTGQRGGRMEGVSGPLRELCGAEDAVAVNNNAAALLLALTALAPGREVIVSRGELVEIGGSFRVPEVIAAGGARLVEVGTTNRTRAGDYARALGPQTAMILRVHPSNFRQIGFVQRPERRALAELAHGQGLPFVEDLGSGRVGELPTGEAEEETIRGVLEEGVDLVCFSGDKLLGGPQAGVAAGRGRLVRELRDHPMYRALRLDKLVLAALEGTLRAWCEGRAQDIPTHAMLNAPPAQLRRRAEAIAARIPGASVEADEGWSGGGALPGLALPSTVVVVPGPAEALAAALRAAPRPVVARVSEGCLRVDPRTLLPGEETVVIEQIGEVLARLQVMR